MARQLLIIYGISTVKIIVTTHSMTSTMKNAPHPTVKISWTPSAFLCMTEPIHVIVTQLDRIRKSVANLVDAVRVKQTLLVVNVIDARQATMALVQKVVKLAIVIALVRLITTVTCWLANVSAIRIRMAEYAINVSQVFGISRIAKCANVMGMHRFVIKWPANAQVAVIQQPAIIAIVVWMDIMEIHC